MELFRTILGKVVHIQVHVLKKDELQKTMSEAGSDKHTDNCYVLRVKDNTTRAFYR